MFFYTDYMNENMNGPSSALSEVLTPKYEDLRKVRADALPSSSQSLLQVPEKPEYQNTGQSSVLLVATASLNNLDHEAGFLPQTTTVPTGNTRASSRFLPAAENLEYLGLGAPGHAAMH